VNAGDEVSGGGKYENRRYCGMLLVVANGIPSTETPVTVTNDRPHTITHTHDFNFDSKSDIHWRDTSGDWRSDS
jgi:hypothetical protein